MEHIKQLLKEMGLSDEQIEKFIKGAINDKFIPKHRMDEVNEKNKQLTEDVKNRDKQIEDLKKFEGDNATLKSKIEELETANKEKDEANAKAIKELKVDNAINYALSGKVQEGYGDLVTGLIDKTLIILKDDGTVSGLDEQLSKIKESKPLLFVSGDGEGGEDGGKPQGWNFKGSDPKDSQNHNKTTVSENFVKSLLEDNKNISEETKSASEFYFGKQ